MVNIAWPIRSHKAGEGGVKEYKRSGGEGLKEDGKQGVDILLG